MDSLEVRLVLRKTLTLMMLFKKKAHEFCNCFKDQSFVIVLSVRDFVIL